MILIILMIIGLLCWAWCVKDILGKSHLDLQVKLILIGAVFCFNWVGVIAYLIVRNRI